MEEPTAYRPGACNIGREERRRRYRLGGVCLLGAAAYLVTVLAVASLPAVLLLGLFVPLSLGIEFLLQARRSFCARLGFRGRFDFDEPRATPDGGPRVVSDDESTGQVSDPADRATDRRYAFRLTVLGVLGGGVGTVLVYAAVVTLG